MNEVEVQNEKDEKPKFPLGFCGVKEISEMLGMHPMVVSKMVKEKKIPGYKPYNKWLFRKDEVIAFIEKSRNM